MDSIVPLLQGIYFLVTGVWPIISIKTFMLVTGPKTDIWLVKTFGAVLAAIGGALIFAYLQNQVNGAVAFVAIGSAAALTVAEFNYVWKRVISPIYLLDAVAEIIIIAWWLIAMNVST